MSAPRPSSTSNGFFQECPRIEPGYWPSDRAVETPDCPVSARLLRDVCDLYLPRPLPGSLDDSLQSFAELCLAPETLRLMDDCERNQPRLQNLNTFGDANLTNPLVTGEGWRKLKDIQTSNGIVAFGYHAVPNTVSYNRRIHQFALATLWSPSCASVSCPAAMTDGAAMLLQKHLTDSKTTVTSSQDSTQLRSVLQEAYNRLTSFEPTYAWTSGQWMTERPGGSDVSRTETLARLLSSAELRQDAARLGAGTDSVGMPLGPWLVDGFKWFSSATDADMVVLLAQTSRGLSLFYAPMKRRRVAASGTEGAVMNGVKISRLKNKLGTKGLPTAEVEISGMRAWLLGQEGHGVREISTILNATRVWTASGAVGGWARALSVAQSFAQVRLTKGNALLMYNGQHVRWMADEVVKYHANAHLTFLAVALLGISEQGQSAVQNTQAQQWLPCDSVEARALLRLLTPVAKALCSLASTLGVREVMESLGGVGYCENDGVLNVARLFRDSAVNSIWEGTTSILAEDFVRAVKGSSGTHCMRVLDTLLRKMLARFERSCPQQATNLQERWVKLEQYLRNSPTSELLYHGRRNIRAVHFLLCCSLLFCHATLIGTSQSRLVAERWMAIGLDQSTTWPTAVDTSNQSDQDAQILFGQKHKQETGSRDSKI